MTTKLRHMEENGILGTLENPQAGNGKGGKQGILVDQKLWS